MTSCEQHIEMQSDQEEVPTSLNHLRRPLHNATPSAIVKDARDYKDLLNAYISLKSSYNNVVAKQKNSTQSINKLKKELQTCKRRLAGKHCPRQKSAGTHVGADAKERADFATQFMDDSTQAALLERLTDAERQLKLLGEITNLPSNDKENIDLQQKLEETTTELSVMKSKVEFQENKIESQCSKLEQILTLHGEYKSKYDRLKRELRFTQNENVQLKEILKEFIEQNALITQLCEEPTESYVERQMLNESKHQTKIEFDQIKSEYNHLKQAHEKLLLELGQQRGCTDGASHDLLKQKLNLTEEELDRTKRLLALQVSINDTIEKERKEIAAAHSNELKKYQKKTDDLLQKATQDQQRIRLLEGMMDANRSNSRLNQRQGDELLHSLGPDENILEVHIASVSLEGNDFADQTCSFVLIDFHTFGSVLSSIANGMHPEYGLSAIYKLKSDYFALAIAGGLRIELYIVQHDRATLFATAVLSCEENEDISSYLPRFIGSNELKLCRHCDGAAIGTLNVRLKLAQPLFPKILDTDGSQSCLDLPPFTQIGIELTVDRLTLKNEIIDSNYTYFVSYSFFGNRSTEVQTCNDKEEVLFQHDEVFPIILSNEYIQNAVGSISKRQISFAVFRGNGDTSNSAFSVIGEAKVELDELLKKNGMCTEVVSLQASVIGDLHLRGRTITRK